MCYNIDVHTDESAGAEVINNYIHPVGFGIKAPE